MISILSVNAQTPNWQWAKSEGGTSIETSDGVCTDAIGNVFMTGYFKSPTITFGTTTLTNAGSNDVFIVKYDATGNVLWAKSAGGVYGERGQSVCTDASGNVFITGSFYSDNLYIGTTWLFKSEWDRYNDIFIVKYDTSGNVLWAKSAGGTGYDFCRGVSTDVSGNVFITGYFGSPNINFGTTTLTNAGGMDIFIAKLGGITGINDIKNSNIKIYPNPTNNIFNIEGLTKNENNTIQIFDVQGKLVITKTINEKGTIDLSELNKGIYVIKIGEVAQRIVKM